MKEISSLNNPLIKEIVELKKKSSKRKKMGLCVVEGEKEISIAIASGFEIETLLVRRNDFDALGLENVAQEDIILCSDAVIEKLSLRDGTTKCIATFKATEHKIEDLSLPENPLILILEHIEKPGNIGAILRTCDAVGVDAVFFTNLKTDIYNPHIIRNSLGCVFSQKIITCNNHDALDFCIKHNVQLYVTDLESENSIYTLNYKTSTALVFGNEHHGVSDFWAPYNKVKIPMNGKIDSMNISNSVAVLAYEVFRQRI